MTPFADICTVLVADSSCTASSMTGAEAGGDWGSSLRKDWTTIDVAVHDPALCSSTQEAAPYSRAGGDQQSGARCSVIVMAEQQSGHAVTHALKSAVVEYVQSPAATEGLLHALQQAQRHLDGRRALRSGSWPRHYRVLMQADPNLVLGVCEWLVTVSAGAIAPAGRLRVRGALQELLLNAVEHGSLEIAGSRKQEALAQGCFEQLVRTLRTDPRLASRAVMIEVCQDDVTRTLVYTVRDQGPGFDWQETLRRLRSVRESTDANGRGLLLAFSFFPSLRFNAHGNEVTFSVPLS